MKTSDREYFGKWEERYKRFPHLAAKWHRMKHQVNHPDREWLHQHLEQPVLDAGCGNAVDARAFAEYVGIDLTPSLLRAAREAFKTQKHLVYADARYMPFRGGSFKTSYAKDLLLHLRWGDAFKVIKELTRVGARTFVAWGIMVYTGKRRLYTPLEDRQVTRVVDGYWANRFSKAKLRKLGFWVGPVVKGTSITEVRKR